MTIGFDLRGYQGVSPRRRERALSELSSLLSLVPHDRVAVLADGEAAFAARLALTPRAAVRREPGAETPTVTYRAFGESNPYPKGEGAMLVEVGNLGRLADGEEGPADSDGVTAARYEGWARDEQVFWRVAVAWEGHVLRRSLSVPEYRIWNLPARAPELALERISALQLPLGLPDTYLLCLTPIGGDGDFDSLVAAHAALGKTASMLVMLGLDDDAWRPAISAAIERSGSRARVCVLRDLDPVSEVAAIARARGVIAIDCHPTHAVRLQQAALLGRPAAVRRHPGHDAWVEGGCWFGDTVGDLVDALADPTPIRVKTSAPCSDARKALANRLAAFTINQR